MDELKEVLRLMNILAVLIADFGWIYCSFYSLKYTDWHGLRNHYKICLIIHGLLVIILFVLFMKWLWL